MVTFDDPQEKKATEEGQEFEAAPDRGPEPSRWLHDKLGQLKTLLNPFVFPSRASNVIQPHELGKTASRQQKNEDKTELASRKNFQEPLALSNQSQGRRTGKICRRKRAVLTAAGGWGLARAGGLGLGIGGGYGRLTN